jgi:hypothetical protein
VPRKALFFFKPSVEKVLKAVRDTRPDEAKA